MIPVTVLLLFPNRWAVLAFAPVPLIWISRWIAQGRPSVGTNLDVPLTLIFLTTCMGFVISPERTLSVTMFWHIILGISLYYSLVNTLDTPERCLLAGRILVLGASAVALLTLFGTDWEKVRFLDLEIYRRLPNLVRNPTWGGLMATRGEAFNPRPIAMGLAMLLPVPMAHALLLPWGREKAVSLGVTLVVGGILLLTQAIQALLGLGLATLLLATWRRRRAWLAAAGIAAVALAAILSYGPERIAMILLSPDNPLGIAVVLRLDMWSRAAAIIKEMPFTGAGLDTFSLIQPRFFPGVLLGTEPHAHNLFLQVALDLGIPGLVATLWLWIELGRLTVLTLRRCHTTALQTLLVGCATGTVAYLGAGLIDSPWSTKSGMAVWVLMGIVAAVARHHETPRSRETHHWQRVAGSAYLGIVLLAFWLLPGLAARNLGTLLAHQQLVAIDQGKSWTQESLIKAIEPLERAIKEGGDNGQTYRTLGQLYAWLSEPEAALQALYASVEIDGANPLARFAPWEYWRDRIQRNASQDWWQQYLRIASFWQARYPERAELHTVTAIIWERHLANVEQARLILQSALERGAEPALLITAYRDRMR